MEVLKMRLGIDIDNVISNFNEDHVSGRSEYSLN